MSDSAGRFGHDTGGSLQIDYPAELIWTYLVAFDRCRCGSAAWSRPRDLLPGSDCSAEVT
jgi:hypothetical protein